MQVVQCCSESIEKNKVYKTDNVLKTDKYRTNKNTFLQAFGFAEKVKRNSISQKPPIKILQSNSSEFT